jgi:hypothetical protein
MEPWTASVLFEDYNGSAASGLFDSELQSPGIVDFRRTKFGVDYSF